MQKVSSQMVHNNLNLWDFNNLLFCLDNDLWYLAWRTCSVTRWEINCPATEPPFPPFLLEVLGPKQLQVHRKLYPHVVFLTQKETKWSTRARMHTCTQTQAAKPCLALLLYLLYALHRHPWQTFCDDILLGHSCKAPLCNTFLLDTSARHSVGHSCATLLNDTRDTLVGHSSRAVL